MPQSKPMLWINFLAIMNLTLFISILKLNQSSNKNKKSIKKSVILNPIKW